MQTHYTPGPWKVAEIHFGERGSQPFIITEDEVTKIGETPATRNSNGDHNRRAPEITANARLIAAAPDLVEALENVLSYASHCAANEGESPSCLEEARAALQKAGVTL